MAIAESVPASWHGTLELLYARRDRGTQPLRSYAVAPLKLQRPFYPEGPEVCHSVILHTAGGVVGGDRLSLHIDLQPWAHALITTAAASKIYRSPIADPIPISRQQVQVRVSEGACLEWFPQEAIVFEGAVYQQSLHVDLEPDALWIGWELTRLGRSARGEQFLSGSWRSTTEIWRGDRPLWSDPQWIPGDPMIWHSPHGLAGAPVVGSFVIVGRMVPDELIAKARHLWSQIGMNRAVAGEVGVTALLEGMLCRYRGTSTAEARAWFIAVWDLVRSSMLDKPACLPRVWPIHRSD